MALGFRVEGLGSQGLRLQFVGRGFESNVESGAPFDEALSPHNPKP